MAKPFAWSYSVLSMYDTCPKKYYHIKVAKDAADDDSKFAGEGKAIHDALYQRVVHGKPLPLPLRYLEPLAKRFAGVKGEKHGELQLALNRNFDPCDWFAKDTYVRAIIDLLIIQGDTAVIVDWKTGKVRPDFAQIKLSAAVLARQMPEIKKFKLAFVWTKHNEVTPITMGAEHMADVWTDMLERANEIEEALKTTTFPAQESPLCKWCPVKQCPHYAGE